MIATDRRITVNDEEASVTRLALENQIVVLLRFWGEWTSRILQTYMVYQKFGGIFTREQFDELAVRK